MKKDLILSGIMIILMIISLLNEFTFLSLVFIILSFLFFIKYQLYEINILNEDCNPKLFFERNKNKEKQILNCTYALVYMYKKENENLIEEYIKKSKNNKKYNHNDIYKMKVHYIENYYKVLKGELENQDDFLLELNNEITTFSNKLRLNRLFNNVSCNLNVIQKHYENGICYLENNLKEKAYAEFLYVSKKGGTTYYKEISDKYIEDLKDYKTDLKPMKIHISNRNKYSLNENLINFSMIIFISIYILLFILI